MFTISADTAGGANPEPEVLSAFKNWRVLITTVAGDKYDGVIQDVNFVNDTVVMIPWNPLIEDVDFASPWRAEVGIFTIADLYIF